MSLLAERPEQASTQDTQTTAQNEGTTYTLPSMRSLALVATAGVALGLEVHTPAHARAVYAERRADFTPRGYSRNGPITVVEACPCDWLINDFVKLRSTSLNK